MKAPSRTIGTIEYFVFKENTNMGPPVVPGGSSGSFRPFSYPLTLEGSLRASWMALAGVPAG
eukprot:11180051-Alexandrium_andersonii.AAC.1